MAEQDTSHHWTEKTGAWACSVCGALYNDRPAFYPCLGSPVAGSQEDSLAASRIDWFALNRSSGG